MRVAYCYRGFFNINYYRNNGSNQKFLSEFEKILKNHKEFLFNDLKSLNYSVDYFFSTYSSNKQVEEIIYSIIEPKVYFTETQSLMNVNSHTSSAQLIHYKNLIHLIQQEEKKSQEMYDLILILRPDIEIFKRYKDFNLSKDEFNIPFIHKSGNCDDNFWIFNRNLLNGFNKSINELYNQRRITHEINHALKNNNVKCHYIEGLTHDSIFNIYRVF